MAKELKEAFEEVLNCYPSGRIGGTGGAGETPREDVQSFDRPSLTESQRSEAMEMFVGSTGAIAQMPKSVGEAQAAGLDLTAMRTKFRREFKAYTLEEKVSVMEETWGKLSVVMSDANAKKAMAALIIGEMGISAKSNIPHGKWLDYAYKNILFIEIRALQNYMRIASIRGVEDNLELGVTALISLAPLAEDPRYKDEKNPLGAIMCETGPIRHDQNIEDYALRAKVAIARHNLERKGISVELEALRSFYAAGFKLSSVDIKEMEHRQDDGNSTGNYLEDVLKMGGTRSELLTHKNKKTKNESASSQMNSAVIANSLESPVPDVDSSIQRTREAVIAILQSKNIEPSTSEDPIEALIADLQVFQTLKTMDILS